MKKLLIILILYNINVSSSDSGYVVASGDGLVEIYNLSTQTRTSYTPALTIPNSTFLYDITKHM